MGKRLAILCALMATALPALAARRMTVDELQQALTAAQSAHRTDDVVAQQLTGVKLAARLNDTLLQQLIALSPGPKTIQSLHAIAALSAFLDPPAADIPDTPKPDAATQSAIIGAAFHYVARILPTLPNLLATRVTENYVDTLRGLDNTEAEQRGELYRLGAFRTPIAYRDGHETDDPTAAVVSTASSAKNHPDDAKHAAAEAGKGLSSWGEFGPILKVVLGDSIKGKLTWSRWETIDGKPAAIFHTVIDRAISHYGLKYCCITRTDATAAGYIRREQPAPFRQTPYHADFAVDPDTGAILRISIQTDLEPQDGLQQASMMVEYRALKIGDNPLVCPTHSVSISLARVEVETHGAMLGVNQLLVNDVEFVDYHRFGSESKLIAEAGPTPSPSPQPSAETPAQITPAGQNAPTQSAPTQSEPASPTPAPTPATNLTAEATPSAPPQPPSNPAKSEPEKEIQLQAADGLAGFGADTAKPAGNNETGSYTLKVTTRSVDVGLVADDKHGKPIADLKQDDFSLFDNGRKQQLIAFRHATPSATAAPAAPEPDPGTFTNTAPAVAQSAETPDTLILLIDESHLGYQDLNQARGEMLRFLNASHTNSPVALYSISEQGFHILQDVTRDHALVAKKLASWTPDARAVAQAQALDRRNRQQFDTVHSAKDLDSVNGNNIAEPETVQPADIELRQLGDTPLRYALEGLTAFARHFAPVPGRKILAWISGDSALADWEDQATGMDKMDKGNQQLQFAFLHTREALNEAGIALYVVDASAIEGNAIDASLGNRNVEVNPVSQQTPQPKDNTAGRLTAQMQQNNHAIQGPVRQLAEATGGRAFNRGSDLKATLDGIDREAAGFYELAFDPDTQADGKFHALQVKVPARKDITLRYRTGFIFTPTKPAPAHPSRGSSKPFGARRTQPASPSPQRPSKPPTHPAARARSRCASPSPAWLYSKKRTTGSTTSISS